MNTKEKLNVIGCTAAFIVGVGCIFGLLTIKHELNLNKKTVPIIKETNKIENVPEVIQPKLSEIDKETFLLDVKKYAERPTKQLEDKLAELENKADKAGYTIYNHGFELFNNPAINMTYEEIKSQDKLFAKGYNTIYAWKMFSKCTEKLTYEQCNFVLEVTSTK